MDSSKQKSDSFHTLQMKPGETELLRLRNQTNAVGALAELVWNAIDADAKNIHVDWKENEMMGVESITISDDGCLMLHELGSLERQRSINFNEWCTNIMERPEIPRKLKCMSIVEDYEEGGNMLVGSSYGDIFVMSIGREV